ncbi:hypothetical protein HYDPIDRAFT_189506 [Hydnomerulius pinastri MD-312]|uniref:F-box domain-containing protein n=1 Tax=Hydnomerulius pinastri MD-312 TaxID=994086 RepID=A0A0C9VUC6_9AGAM|nr:hypothetical protein HYDPIDRAFT_189506 [Hydnomerulius pinastri MD-312]
MVISRKNRGPHSLSGHFTRSPSLHRWAQTGLTHLPTELLCHVLSYLDAHQLVRARRICKVIKCAIDFFELHQYTIDLGFYQMYEGQSPPGHDRSPVPVATRRKELRQFEASWRRLQYRHRTTFPLPIAGPVYEFVGGIYALTGENSLRFAVLPDGANPHSEEPIRTWDFGVDTASMIDFTFCPSQDLLVIVTMTADNEPHAYDLHMRTLSLNKPHPNATLPIIKALNKGEGATDFYHAVGPVKLQIMGNYLALLCRDTVVNSEDIGDYLQLWTWTAESGYGFVLRFEESINDFAFISSDRFVLLADDGTLEIYSFGGDKQSSPICMAKLGMPKLMRDWQFADAFLGGNPSPATVGMSATGYPWLTPHAVPDATSSNGSSGDGRTQFAPPPVPTFHPNRDDQLIAIHVTVLRSTNETDTHSFVYFVMRSTILRMEGVYQDWFGGPPSVSLYGLGEGSKSTPNHAHEHSHNSAPVETLDASLPSGSSSMVEITITSGLSSLPSSPISSLPDASDSTTDPDPPPSLCLPWTLWGPCTHWFPDALHVDWQNSVFGFRTIESINEDQDTPLGGYFSRKPRKLRVRDFNPNLAFHYHGEDLEGWTGRLVKAGEGESGSARGGKGWGVEIKPFVDPLGKGLSYREVESEERFDVTEAMMDESRILLLRRRSENGELEKVDVLVM